MRPASRRIPLIPPPAWGLIAWGLIAFGRAPIRTARAEQAPQGLLTPQPERGLPQDPPAGWATFAGTATALLPLAVGGAFFAEGADSARRKGASIGIAAGLALAPIVSHLVAREWTRAAIFGAIPVACLTGTVALLELQPTSTVYGTRDGRLAYGLLLSFATLASATGVLDTLGATRRARERAPRRAAVLPLPFALPGGGGLTVGGTLP